MKRIEFHTKLAGVTYRNPDGTNRQDLIEELEDAFADSGEVCLDLKREPDNQYDSNAIAVLDPFGRQLGYLSREVAAQLAPDLDGGVRFDVVVAAITGGGLTQNYGVNVGLARAPDCDSEADSRPVSPSIKRPASQQPAGHGQAESEPTHNEAPAFPTYEDYFRRLQHRLRNAAEEPEAGIVNGTCQPIFGGIARLWLSSVLRQPGMGHLANDASRLEAIYQYYGQSAVFGAEVYLAVANRNGIPITAKPGRSFTSLAEEHLSDARRVDSLLARYDVAPVLTFVVDQRRQALIAERSAMFTKTQLREILDSTPSCVRTSYVLALAIFERG